LQRIEQRIKEIEKEIPKLEEKSVELTRQLSKPEVASNLAKLNEVTRKIEETEQKTQNLYKEWEELLAY
jgi:ATP-binding cassette subfamily F protein 3